VEEISKFKFKWNEEEKILLADKDKSSMPQPRYIIDLNKQIVVVQMPNQNEYVMEEIDSVFNESKKLEPTGETKEIKGYKCTRYLAKEDMTIKGAVGKPSFHTEYSLWVTDDIAWNQKANAFIFALLQGGYPVTANFRGTLVEFDITTSVKENINSTVIVLDTEKLNKEWPEIHWPWLEPDGVAWIEGEVPSVDYAPGRGYAGSGHAHYRIGDGSLKKQNTRTKALLQRITGQEEPKTKRWIYGNSFWN